MAHVFDGNFSKLESEDRKRILPVDELLESIGIREGMTVIDFGCGIGYFSIPIAQKIGKNGLVVAIDISERMILELRRRSQGIKNIEIIRSDDLCEKRADLILLANVLHELDDKEKFLDSCFEALNERGSLVIIDWQKKETKMGPPLDHRLSKEEVIRMTDRKYVKHPIDDSLYFLEFKKEF